MSRPGSSSSGEPSGWRLVNSLLGSARRKSAGLLTGALRSVGLSRARRVRFQPNCTVLEFERELFGGGGVPEADNVSLGLSPKLFGTYSVTLADKHGKDEYAASGYLESSVKAQLLSQWEDEPVLEERLEVASEIERTRRERQESASSRRDQRQMPANTKEALEVAAKDAMAAREAARPRKARPTPGGSPPSGGKGKAAASRGIQKRARTSRK